MSTPTALEGGCLCGAVRYRIDGAVTAVGVCHCESCRRAAGADSVAWATIASDGLRFLAGEIAVYPSSPGVLRGFCSRCGSSLTYQRHPSQIDVTLATLDDPESLPPRDEWWLEERLSWNPENPKLQPFARGGSD